MAYLPSTRFYRKKFTLLEPDCPPLPEAAQLPLVFVNGDVLSSGGKLSMPAIRKRLEALGVTAIGDHS